jgi:hypothetical protein
LTSTYATEVFQTRQKSFSSRFTQASARNIWV